MGLPPTRFVDECHEKFICTFCLDVAEYPQAIPGCPHTFCRQCIETSGQLKCPACQESFFKYDKAPNWAPLKGLSQRIYIAMKIKCLNATCDQLSDPINYGYHDSNCEEFFEVCDNCEYKWKQASDCKHSCIKVIKEYYAKKLEEMEEKLQEELDTKLQKEMQATEIRMQTKLDSLQQIVANGMLREMPATSMDPKSLLKLVNTLKSEKTEERGQGVQAPPIDVSSLLLLRHINIEDLRLVALMSDTNLAEAMLSETKKISELIRNCVTEHLNPGSCDSFTSQTLQLVRRRLTDIQFYEASYK